MLRYIKRFFKWMFPRVTVERSFKDRMLHDSICTILLLATATGLCILTPDVFGQSDTYSVAIFILAIAYIARFTQGYIWSAISSLLGVICVNYMFTYPYYVFNTTPSGYPLTIASMLVVSICVSTQTTRLMHTEKLRTEMLLEKMHANLLRAISHDLRTPLTSIVGSSSVLLEDPALSNEQRNELLQEINKSALWLSRITQNILSVTKFSSDEVKLHEEYEVAEEIVSSAIVKFHQNYASIPISIDRPQEILLAPMDGTLIEQVLLNLFDNAVVHGKTTTHINVCISRAADALQISVTDDGQGIPEDALPHLFDGNLPAQSDDSRNMGIGLSVCLSIVRAHGGQINGRNVPDGGAQFSFYLPLKEDTKYEPAEI